MNLDYQKVTEYSTRDLPLVIASTDLIFGFKTSPTYQTIIDLQQFTTHGGDDKELVRLAAQSLVYIQTPDNERYDLSTPEAVQVLIDQTDVDFVRNVIISWFVLCYAQINHDKKKLIKSYDQSQSNGVSPSPAGESLTN